MFWIVKYVNRFDKVYWFQDTRYLFLSLNSFRYSSLSRFYEFAFKLNVECFVLFIMTYIVTSFYGCYVREYLNYYNEGWISWCALQHHQQAWSSESGCCSFWSYSNFQNALKSFENHFLSSDDVINLAPRTYACIWGLTSACHHILTKLKACTKSKHFKVMLMKLFLQVIGIDPLSQCLLPTIVELAEDRHWRVRLAVIDSALKTPLTSHLFVGTSFFVSRIIYSFFTSMHFLWNLM